MGTSIIFVKADSLPFVDVVIALQYVDKHCTQCCFIRFHWEGEVCPGEIREITSNHLSLLRPPYDVIKMHSMAVFVHN